MVMSETPFGNVGPPLSAGSDVSDTDRQSHSEAEEKSIEKAEKNSPSNLSQTNIVRTHPQTKEPPMRPLVAPVFAGFFAVLAASCASSAPEVSPALTQPARTAWIVGRDGRAIGQAQFTEAPTGVLIRMEFSPGALSPGWHGLHLHGRGDCSDAAAGFQASGGHVGMHAGVAHGLRNPAGPEAGDLPNIFAGAGPFGAEVFSPYVTLHRAPIGDRQPLMDGDGAALLIHANADDHQAQPIGGAGERTACAALTPLP
jgi:Cu-Zn family superoxide dismutase